MALSMSHEEKRVNEKLEEEKQRIDRMNSLIEFIEEYVVVQLWY